jgi:hypothetical protein
VTDGALRAHAIELADWQQMRERWHFFQGVHGALFAAAFVLLAIPLMLTRR